MELIFAPVTRNQFSSTPEQKAVANEHLSTYYPTGVLNEGQPAAAAAGVTHNTGAALCCCDSCHFAY